MKNLWILFIFISTSFFALAEDQIIDPTIFKARDTDLVYGKENAPIEVLEFYSLTCPHCAYFYDSTFPVLKKEFIDTGKVRWIKRSFISDYAAAQGTLFLNCVAKDRYEVFLKILFRKQSSWAYQKDPLPILQNIGNLGGISTDKFLSCVNNKAEETKLHQATDQARNLLKLSGTPVFFVNHERLKGYSYEFFKEEFDKILNKSK